MKKYNTKFNRKFPLATNVALDSNGTVWGVFYNLPNTEERFFYPIEHFEEHIEYETEVFISKLVPMDKEYEKICLN